MTLKAVGDEIGDIWRQMRGSMTDEEWAAHDAKLQAEAEERTRRAEEEVRVERLAWLVQDVGVPAKDIARIEGAEGISETRAMRAVREQLAERLMLVVLSGTRGSGKTTAAAWWLAQRQPKHDYVYTQNPFFIDANHLARWPRYDDSKMERIEKALCLVIDDLGVEYDDKQGNFRSLFDALVNARYASMLPTVITTNLNAEQFKERYGERVADRIREVGRFVSIADESLRGRK